MGTAKCLFFSLSLVMIRGTGALAASQEIEFRLQDGYRIVVTGSIAGVDGIAMMIDTGATCSLVDKKLVQRFDLTALVESVRYNAFGRTESTHRAILRALRIGPILTTLPCLVVDIPYRHVDAIIGLDLLRKYPFTIDFEAKRLTFGPGELLGETISFDPSGSLVLVPIHVGGEVLQVMVDTGADCLYLFKCRVGAGITANSVRSALTSTHLAGKSRIRETRLEKVEIGEAVWRDLQALIVDAAEAPGCDGALGIALLGLKQIHIDFRQGTLSFRR